VKHIVFAALAIVAMLATSLASVNLLGETADARGPAYPGPQTQSSGPAYFGPAPNPFPYCDSPTYFDPFPENVNPIGRMDVGSAASVTTDGLVMDLVVTAEGNPGTQYPGFFPEGGDGSSGDQPKGIELAEGDAASVSLSEPLFYSQWIFTDVDQPNEGFTVTPEWTEVGEAAVFGGDDQWTFAGTSNTAVQLDDIDGVGHASESINGRVQVDFLGAVTGIDMVRTFPSNGQSGFAVGGGCEAAGAAKALVAGPTWNGTSFDVTYELRIGNNLPSSATLNQVIQDAIDATGDSLVTGDVQGIQLSNLQLTDDLSDAAFSNIAVTNLEATGGLLTNPAYDGINNVDLLSGGTVNAESDEVITLSVQYTPDLATDIWVSDCQQGYQYLNQSEVTGTAANVVFTDLSDDGVNAGPSNDNGAGGVDDPTPVVFPCPPADLEIVKTVVAGPNGNCPIDFAGGTQGDGPALVVTDDDTVTYCVSVRNIGPGPLNDVFISDPQAPGDYDIGALAPGVEAQVTYDVQVTTATPPLNTATATAVDVDGAVGPVTDTAVIQVEPKLQPLLEIVKTVVPGPNGDCPVPGIAGLGPALAVDDGSTVTYCIYVENVGAGEATNVVITDPQAPAPFDIGTLAPGADASAAYDLVVGLGTPTRNIATANYDGPDGPLPPVDDDAQIEVLPLQPGLQIVKTALESPDTCPNFDGGVQGEGAAVVVDDRDIVLYCITVRNQGPGIATDVVITDPQAPTDYQVGTLQAGEQQTVSYEVEVTLASPTTNIATANGNGPDGALPAVEDPAVIEVVPLPDPELEIVKTALVGPAANCPSFDGGTAGLGDPVSFLETETVTYCISVRNVGQGPAFDVEIADPQAPATIVVGDLAPGASDTFAYDLVVTVDTPTTNVATATGNGLNGPLTPVDDPAIITVDLQPDPVLEIVKTVVPGPNGDCPATFEAGTLGDGPAQVVTFGDTVTYCITVRNVGGNPATDVIVSDDQAPAPINLGTIEVGESVNTSYDVEVDAGTPPQNTASVTGQGPNGPVGPDSDTALITPGDPILEIVKTVVQGPGGTCPTTFDEGVQGDGTPLALLFDDVATYCIAVRNTGLNDATNVVVTDSQADGDLDIGTVPVGETRFATYDVTVDGDTPRLNTATVNGDGPNGPVPPDSDTAVIAPSPQPDPVLQIVKTVIAGPGGICPATFVEAGLGDGDALNVSFGDTVTYCIAVRNVGLRAATSVVVTDPQAPAPLELGTIEVGTTQVGSYDVVVLDSTPVRNTATVTGEGPNGPVPPDSDTAIIAPGDPILEIVKTVVPGPNGDCPATFEGGTPGDGDPVAFLFGDTATYCIAVRNVGINDATSVVVNDTQAPGPLQIGTVPEGEARFDQYDVAIDAATPLENTATVTGQGPNGPVGPAEDTAVITTTPQPDPVLEIVKTVIPGPAGDCPAAFDAAGLGDGDALVVTYGDTVTYCVNVRNVGERAATDVVVNDAQAPAPIELGTIDVDGQASGSYDVVVSDQTPVQNTATATGQGPNGPVGPVSDTAVITPGDPVLEIVKTVVAGPNGECPSFADGVPGVGTPLGVQFTETVTYCIAVRNTGANDATNVVITDPQAPGPFDIGVLPVNAERIRSYDVVIDADTPETNVATVTGDGPNGPIDPVEDPAEVTTSPLPDPVLEIVKTVLPGPGATCPSFGEGAVGEGDALSVEAGETVTYCISIRNTGEIEAQDVVISDDQAPESPYDMGTLAIDEVKTISYDVLITETSPLTNVAVGTGQGPNGPTDPVEDPAVIDTRSVSIALIHSVSKADEDCETVAKNLNSLVANREELDITWCAEIQNNGNVPLTDVVLTAPRIGDGEQITVTAGDAVLLPGETIFLPIPGQIPDRGVISSASVQANPSDADGNVLTDLPRVRDDDNAEVREASIDLDTTVVEGANGDCTRASEVIEVLPNADVTWCFAITNTGAIDLEVERVTDPDLGVTAIVPEDQRILRVGRTIFVQANDLADLDEDELVIDADVRGQPLDFDGTALQAPEVEDIDPARIVIPEADLQIVKTVSNPGPTTIDTPIAYTLTITNNGPDAARGVVVTDTLPVGMSYVSLPDDDDWACSLDADQSGFRCLKATNLPAEESVVLTYVATTNVLAPANSQLENVATVGADTPDPDPTNNEDTAITTTPRPAPTGPTPRSLPEDPGPFTLPEPPEVVPPPDEVLGLAITGAASNLLTLISAVMLSIGGLFTIGARRARDEDQ
jgi:uncharacterized repeat protein (TIGR01451 family)